MKSTGIVRRIDDLGRVIIPKEIRRTVNITEGDSLEIFLQDDMICLARYDAGLSYVEQLERICKLMKDDYIFSGIVNNREILLKLKDIVKLMKEAGENDGQT